MENTSALNYVYQPLPITEGKNIYAVGGIDVPLENIHLQENYALTQGQAVYRAWDLNNRNGRIKNG